MSGIAFLFPGQGAQFVGMGKSLCESFPGSADAMRRADEALGFELSQLCFEGPEDELTCTENAQPAILTMSIAALQPVLAAGLRPSVVMGHSLGEYSALVCAGALTLGDAVRLVRKRGLYMRDCGEAKGGSMAAILGLEDGQVQELVESCANGRVLCAANFNTPGQVVISGEAEAVEEACAAAKAAGARRTLPLAVSGAFHTPLMAEAAERLAEEIDATPFCDAGVPVITNVSAEPLQSAADIRRALKDQVTGAVRWRESLERLPGMGITRAVELGAKLVLAGMVRRAIPDVEAVAVYDSDSARSAIDAMAGGQVAAT